MGKDASTALNAPQVAGTVVRVKGSSMRVASQAVGGVIGVAMGSRVARKNSTPTTPTLPTLGAGYLAISETEMVLVKAGGLNSSKPTDQVIAQVPRDTISQAELRRGKVSALLTVEFVDGTNWEFDIPFARTGPAQQLVAALERADA
jgi:hypothetical protein